MFNQTYTEWTRISSTNRSWPNAKKFFRTALADKKAIDKITTGESNFGANAVEVRDDMQELVGTAMDNLSLAAVTKQTTLDMLAQSNTTLVKVNAEQQNIITKLTNKITALEKKLDQSSGGGGGGGASDRFDINMYCWSHGYKNYPNHNSATCRNKKGDISARPPVRTLWEVAFGMQDLAMPPTERYRTCPD